MPKKGRGKSGVSLDPLKLPTDLQTALHALYGHYSKTFDLWAQAGIEEPPVFIVVWLCCTNTVRDSSCESSVIAGGHEQTELTDLQDAELARV
jgi:type III restriction enzyme